MWNEHLEHQVNQSIMQSAELSSLPILIKAHGGVVTLDGQVQSYRRKLVAQLIAESCEGVSTVVNNLTVTPRLGVPDESVAQGAKQRLRMKGNLPIRAIRVDVRGGTLTLTGYVKNEHERRNAADVGAAADGVRKVCNLLIVNPHLALENLELANTICAEVRRTPGMGDQQLTVSVVDETARISGQVDDLWKKDFIEQVVRRHEILNVCNDIVVKPARR